VFYEFLSIEHQKLMDLKDQFGELSAPKLKHLKYVESALQLFENTPLNKKQDEEVIEQNAEIEKEKIKEK
jgi:hypothetical protein